MTRFTVEVDEESAQPDPARSVSAAQAPGVVELEYAATFERDAERESFHLGWERAPSHLLPLCHVVGTAWLYAPEAFLASVLRRTGQSFEGAVAFAYHEDDPFGLPPGVTCDYFDESCVVDEAFFDAFVVSFVEAWLKAAGSPAAAEARWLELRGRGRRGGVNLDEVRALLARLRERPS